MSSNYLPASVGAAGLSIPSYGEILADVLLGYQKIYGANQYVGNDSAIYQFISIICLKISDCNQGLQYQYNQAGALTAVGAGQDRLYKLNGIARLPYTYSAVLLTITGTPGTVIANGVAQDVNGKQWLLPQPSITIPGGGSINVMATCTTPGNITAEPGTITTIATPIGGWTGVTNSAAAIPGNPIETDSQFRARQSISVALPSVTRLAGTIAGLLAVPGVTRINVLENPTSGVDAFGNPPHSITCVVDGTATQLAIATAIYANRGIGCDTNGYVNGAPVSGTVTVQVNDPATDYPNFINYLTPSYVPVYVSANIFPLTSAFTSATLAAIQQAIVAYLNSLQIGESCTLSALYAAAMSATPNISQPIFSVRSMTLGFTPSPSGMSDLNFQFFQVSSGVNANVVLTET